MENFDIGFQVHRLGLENLFSAPASIKILDVGCGRTMELVRHMQKNGFFVEGLDSEISRNYSGAIKQKITNSWPKEGAIPRNSEYYDLVIAHQNPFVTESASELRDTSFIEYMCYRGENREEEQKKTVDPVAQVILSEMFRVTAEYGVNLLYPGIQFLDKKFPEIIPERKIVRHLPIDGIPKENLEVWFEDGLFGGIVRDDVSFMATHRTVIYNPEKVNGELARALKLY